MKNPFLLFVSFLFNSIVQGQHISDSTTIGTQIWTSKNLDVSTYRNGDTIPKISDPKKWAALTTGAWCYYDNDIVNGKIYGKLYNWYAINDARGLAPFGWHVPTEKEWIIVINYCGGEVKAGGKLKETGFSHWEKPNGGAIDFYNFTALPGGFRDSTGTFNVIGKNGSWWCSTETTPSNAIQRTIIYFGGIIFGYAANKQMGFSIRCIKD